MSAPTPDGTTTPFLMVKFGAYPVFVAEQGQGCIKVGLDIRIGDVARQKLMNLSPEDKRKATTALRGELSSNPRAAYSWNPPNSATLDQLQLLEIVELLKIVESDVSTFNRFIDAIQEVVTGGDKVFQLFSRLESLP
jgi:hypothetical protein